MQFNRVRVMVRSSVMNSSPSVQYEHMIPVLQVIKGAGNVTEMEPDESCGPVVDADGNVIDFDLNEEWNRMMDRAKMVKQGENSTMPAPLIVYPRGVPDLEDFYARLRRPRDTAKPVAAPVKDERSAPKGLPNAKEQRAAAKKRLDDLGIEYKGNASTESLIELLNEVDNADVQNEG